MQKDITVYVMFATSEKSAATTAKGLSCAMLEKEFTRSPDLVQTLESNPKIVSPSLDRGKWRHIQVISLIQFCFHFQRKWNFLTSNIAFITKKPVFNVRLAYQHLLMHT